MRFIMTGSFVVLINSAKLCWTKSTCMATARRYGLQTHLDICQRSRLRMISSPRI